MLPFIWSLVYSNDTPPPAGDTPPADSEASGDETPPPPPPSTGKPKPAFSQEDVNRFLAEERRKQEAKNKSVIGQLENLKKNVEMTAQQKEALEKQIEELRNASLTKEEQLKREQEKAAKVYAEEKEQLRKQAETWQQRYANETVRRSILDAAVQNEAFNPEQLVNILRGDTRLTEATDEEGKPTGDFIAKTRFNDIGKDGKPVLLDMTVPEAIKRMKESPDRFGNLFKSGATGGLGATTKPGSKGVKIEDLTPAQYRELRKKNPSALGLGE